MKRAITGKYYKKFEKAEKELKQMNKRTEYVIIKTSNGSVIVNKNQLKNIGGSYLY